MTRGRIPEIRSETARHSDGNTCLHFQQIQGNFSGTLMTQAAGSSTIKEVSLKLIWSRCAVPHIRFLLTCMGDHRGKWVPVSTAWRILGIWMEERLPVWKGSCEYIE
jgi:hypothetical protein